MPIGFAVRAPSSKTVIIVLLPLGILLFVAGFFVSTKLAQTAYADGLFQEQLSASLGNRKADLLIKMNPPVVIHKL